MCQKMSKIPKRQNFVRMIFCVGRKKCRTRDLTKKEVLRKELKES